MRSVGVSKSEDKIPLDDPATPAVLRWLLWALLYLLECFIALVMVGWGLGRLLFHSGAFIPLVCGVTLTVATSKAVSFLEHLGNHHIAKGHRSPAQWDRVAADALILLASAAVFVVYRARGGEMSTTATLILLPGAVALWRLRGSLRYPSMWWLFHQLARWQERLGNEGLHARSLAFRELHEADWKGVLPRDWSPDLLRRACGVSGPGDALCESSVYAYYAALDRGDIAEAGACLEHLEEMGPKLRGRGRACLVCEKAFMLARYKGSPGPARGVLRAFHGAANNLEFFRRASASIYLAERRPDALRASAAAALPSKPRKHPSGIVQLHDRLVREMLEEGSQMDEAPRVQAVAD